MNDHIYLAHHGIKGQKWGVRRFQNEDGSLTSAGQKRYGVGGSPMRGASTGGLTNPRSQSMERYVKRNGINGRPDPKAPTYKPTPYKLTRRSVSKSSDQNQDGQSEKKQVLSDKAKRNLKIALGVAATGVVAYSAYKVGKNYINAKKLSQLDIDLKKYQETFTAGRERQYQAANLMDAADQLKRANSVHYPTALRTAAKDMSEANQMVREGFHGIARTTSQQGAILVNESNLDTSIREFFENQLSRR